MDFLGMPELERDVKLEGCGNTLLNLILQWFSFKSSRTFYLSCLFSKKVPPGGGLPLREEEE